MTLKKAKTNIKLKGGELKYKPNTFKDKILNNKTNIIGPAFATNLYERAYSNKDKPNKLVQDLENYNKILEETKETINKLKEEKQKLIDLNVEEQRNNLTILQLNEEISKNDFNKAKDITNLTGNFTQNLLVNLGHFFSFIINTIKNYIEIITKAGQGAIIKFLILFLCIVFFFVTYFHYRNLVDINILSFMNINNKFLIYDNYNNFINNITSKLRGFLPESVYIGFNGISNNLHYISTGKNIYDNYLINRNVTENGRFDNIFHFNKVNNELKDDNYTSCTLKPKDIILNYNDNNMNNDYNKLDSELKDNLDYYKYYHIPIGTDPDGKYKLDLENSSFNKIPSRNTNENINKNLSNYKLFKYSNNNNLIFNSFNNNYYNYKNVENNINTIESYSAYGIELVNPNYNKLNIAIIDINFDYNYFKNTSIRNLNSYISDKKDNIFYIKINSKHPTNIYVTNNKNIEISLFDFMSSNNNISILKLYNQIEYLDIYDLKFNIPQYNDNVIPPKLKYDNENSRFYIDFFLDGDNSCYLEMNKAINGSINPIFEINVNANNLNFNKSQDCDNYFLLFPSIDSDSLFKSGTTDQEFSDIMINFKNTTGEQINYNYDIGNDNSKKTNYYPIITRLPAEIDIISSNKEYLIKNIYFQDKDYLYQRTVKNENKNTYKPLISYAILLYLILNYYSRCFFYINVYDYGYSSDTKYERKAYSIYLLSNNQDGGNTDIFGSKSGLGGADYNPWISNKIFKIDMTKYPNLKTNSKYFNNKSIKSVGSSIFNFKNRSEILNYFNENKEEIHNNSMNSKRLLEKNLYFKEPKSFVGRLYTLVLNRF